MAFCDAKAGNTKNALIGFLLVTGALRVREGGELSKQVLVKMLFLYISDSFKNIVY